MVPEDEFVEPGLESCPHYDVHHCAFIGSAQEVEEHLKECRFEYIKNFLIEKEKSNRAEWLATGKREELEQLRLILQQDFGYTVPDPIPQPGATPADGRGRSSSGASQHGVSDAVVTAGLSLIDSVSRRLEKLHDDYHIGEKARTTAEKARGALGKTKHAIVESDAWKVSQSKLSATKQAVEHSELLGFLEDAVEGLKQEFREEFQEAFFPTSGPSLPPDQQPLPPGWGVRHDSEGRVFFVDYTNRRTTYVDPRFRSPREHGAPADEPTPTHVADATSGPEPLLAYGASGVHFDRPASPSGVGDSFFVSAAEAAAAPADDAGAQQRGRSRAGSGPAAESAIQNAAVDSARAASVAMPAASGAGGLGASREAHEDVGYRQPPPGLVMASPEFVGPLSGVVPRAPVIQAGGPLMASASDDELEYFNADTLHQAEHPEEHDRDVYTLPDLRSVLGPEGEEDGFV